MLISGFTSKSDKAGQTAGLLTSALGSVLKGGVDPLSLGITVVTGLIGIFAGKEEVVVRTTEEVMDSLGLLGEEIEATGAVIESLNDKISSGWIDKWSAQLDEYIERLRTATGQSKKNLEILVEQTQDYLDKLTAAFAFDTEFTNLTEGFGYLLDEAQRMVALYGTEFEGYSGILDLIQEKMYQTTEQMSELDPNSEAYRILEEQMRQAIQTIVELGGTINVMGEEIDQASFNLGSAIGGFMYLEEGSDA